MKERKTTEKLMAELGIVPTAQVPTTFAGFIQIFDQFRQLAISHERECAKAVAFVDGFRSAALHFDSHWLAVGTHLFTFPPAVQVPEGWKDVAVELPKDGQLIIGCNKDYDTWTEIWDSEEPIGGTRWWIAAPEVK